MTSFDLFSYDQGARPGPVKGVRVRNVKVSVALSPSRLPGLDFALNPYAGCQHDCIYCYAPHVADRARADWGKVIEARYNLPTLLMRELRRKHGVIGLGTMTDPYQPVESRYQLTRRCLEQLSRYPVKVSVHTKGDMINRDIDLLRDMDCDVGITITTMDAELASQIEPGAPPPSRRISALAELNRADVRTYLLLGPVLPLLDREAVVSLLQAVADAGTVEVMLDPYRDRPGVEGMFSRLPFLEDERRRTRFLFDLQSRRFQMEVSATIREVGDDIGLEVIDAF